MCELRILYRLTKETIHDVSRTGIVNVVIITTMAAILTIFASFFRSALSISAFAHELGNVLEISVYLKEDADANIVKTELKNLSMLKMLLLFQKLLLGQI